MPALTKREANSTQQKTIAIAGAGLVGAFAALALSRARPDWQVVLLDPEPGVPRQDPRTLALALRSFLALEEAGVISLLNNADFTPIQTIHVSDTTGPGRAQMKAATEGVPALGYVLEARYLQQALAKACEASAVVWRKGVRIQSIESMPTHQQLTLSDNSELAADLLVVTDGTQSPTRSLLGIDVTQQHYPQQALAGFIEVDRPHEQIAYERFTEQGPMALLPCGQRRFALVWCAQPERMSALMALDDDGFLSAAQQRFGGRAGRFVKATRQGSFPLSMRWAERMLAHRTVLIGNACHALHPVAGQGYNLGVRDVLALVQHLNYCDDPGAIAVLNAYSEQRQPDYQGVRLFTDGLVGLFSNDQALLSAGRRTGLAALSGFSCLGSLLAQKAMGFGAQESLWR